MNQNARCNAPIATTDPVDCEKTHGTGVCSSGSASGGGGAAGTPARAGWGMMGGGICGSFMGWVRFEVNSESKHLRDGAKDRFVKVSLERVGPEKFNRQPGRTNERSEIPAQLAAEKQIANQPGEKHFARDDLAPAQGPQQAQQPRVRRDPGEGD